MYIGKSVKRVDAFEKVTGRAAYTADTFDRHALVGRVLHSTIAHGRVKKIDVSEAEKIAGVVKIITCFDVPDTTFSTAGHPWTMNSEDQSISDRKLLNEHVRYFGDDIALVVAENGISAERALRSIGVEYEEYPFVLDPIEAMNDGAPRIHDKFPNNILKHKIIRMGNCQDAIRRSDLLRVDGWYHLPMVQHCHLEPNVCYAYSEKGRMTVVTSTQIPHILRRIIAQANGLPWGSVRVIKPYVGGGFGNKQDAIWEPLCAFASMCLGGRLVMINPTREEVFVNSRVRYPMHAHLTSWLDSKGTFVARKLDLYVDKGAYASHADAVTATAMNAFVELYPCKNTEVNSYTVYTNKPVGGAMRAYGVPQATFFTEAHTDDICRKLGWNPVDFRRKNSMQKGYINQFNANENYNDTYNQLIDKALHLTDYETKSEEYKSQNSGPIRRGIGMSLFWFSTGVYPISLETSACRMIMNQDGTIQLQLGETEIGQGADTVFSQIAANAIGVPFESINIVSTQDTDIAPLGFGAYASRQTYVASFSIRHNATLFRNKLLKYAHDFLRMPTDLLDIVDGEIIRTSDKRVLMKLSELALRIMYLPEHSNHIVSESTYQVKSNAYSFGVSIAEVEVDIPLCKVKLLDIVNVHDCGTLINPDLAEGQVHGGMSMGIGYGLYENLLLDEKTGRVLNDNLLDYKLPTTMDHPDLKAGFVENPEPTSPFGTKALGEPPACSPAPAIRNAVLQATGVAVNSIPLSPHQLFKDFSEAGLLETEEERQLRRKAYEELKDTVIQVTEESGTESPVESKSPELQPRGKA